MGVVSRVEEYRATLRTLDPADWPGFLTERSGLPGPRGNIELGRAVAEEADAATVDALIATDDEYLVFCGVVGLGRLLADDAGDDPGRLRERLHGHACDERWRVREAVAMALQRLGDADPAAAGRARRRLGRRPRRARAAGGRRRGLRAAPAADAGRGRGRRRHLRARDGIPGGAAGRASAG